MLQSYLKWLASFRSARAPSLIVALSLSVAGNSLSADAELTSTLGGRVVDERSAIGLAGLKVSIKATYVNGTLIPMGERSVSAKTDPEGRFEFPPLPRGSYEITVEPEVSSNLHPLIRLVSLAGSKDVTVDFPLARFGSISGVVKDHAGVHLSGVTVSAFEQRFDGGASGFAKTGSSTTDATGHYKIIRLEGGAYYLLAEKFDAAAKPFRGSADAPGETKYAWAPTYYPNGSDPGATIALGTSQVIDSVDIEMSRKLSFCVSGVSRLEGSPHSIPMTVIRQEEIHTLGGFSTHFEKSNQYGRFSFCGLTPGQYEFAAFDTVDEPSGPVVIYGSSRFVVHDKNIIDADVDARRPVDVPLEIVWDSEDSDARQPQPTFNDKVQPTAPANSDVGQTRPAPISQPPPASDKILVIVRPLDRGIYKADNIGSEEGIPSKRVFRLTPGCRYAVRTMLESPNLFIKGTFYAGRRLDDGQLRVDAAEGGASVKVVVAHHAGAAHVKLANKDGVPCSGCVVVLLPGEFQVEEEMASNVVTANTDQKGEWTFSGLAPGDYYIIPMLTDFRPTPAGLRELIALRAGVSSKVSIGPDSDVATALQFP